MSVHPTAVVDKKARIAESATVGPYAVIGADVELGERCSVGAHSWLDHARIGEGTKIGAHTLIGGDPQMLNWKDAPSLVRIGKNNDIHELVTIHRSKDENGATVLGDGNMIMTNTHIGHDCVIHNNVVMTTYSGLSGHVTVFDGAILGAMAGAHQFVRVGEMSMVGGMARLVQDVTPFMLVEGSPACVRKTNAVGLKRKGFSAEARENIKRAYKILFRSGLNLTNAKERLTPLAAESAEVRRILEFLSATKRGITPGPRHDSGDDEE